MYVYYKYIVNGYSYSGDVRYIDFSSCISFLILMVFIKVTGKVINVPGAESMLQAPGGLFCILCCSVTHNSPRDSIIPRWQVSTLKPRGCILQARPACQHVMQVRLELSSVWKETQALSPNMFLGKTVT